MRRAPIVVTSTVAGLAAVLGFHTHSPQGIRVGTAAAGGGTTGAGGNASNSAPTTAPSTPSTSSAAPASSGTAPRSATGSFIQYRYGDIQLQVTVSGSRITKVSVAQEDSTDPRSQMINSEAIPMLQDQTMSAQSANIDGISGATYTSEAYAQSLQSALDKLGVR